MNNGRTEATKKNEKREKKEKKFLFEHHKGERMVRKSRDIYMTVETLHPEMRTKK